MVEHGAPALVTLLLWWASTGLILRLDALRPETFPWTMAAATALLVPALLGLHGSAGMATQAGAYLGFGCALYAWGWVELAFLTGTITGPGRGCPPGLAFRPRLRAAVAAILWHELAIVGFALLLLALAWGGENQVGPWTFLLLWAMRTSAKLNLFLGVRNPGEEFLPDHLRYLGSHFRRARMNPLFPLSLAGATILAALLFRRALAPDAEGAEAVGFTLLGSLAALAAMEHAVLMLPLSLEGLWRRGAAKRAPGPVSSAASP